MREPKTRSSKRARALKGAMYTYDPVDTNLPKGYTRIGGNRDVGGGSGKGDYIYDIFHNEKTGDYQVSFKGTTTGQEWKTNLIGLVTPSRVLKKGIINGKLHSGFAASYEALHDQLQKDLEVVPRGAKIHVSGHSLGGAMAQVAAANMHHSGHHVKSLITFGAPSVGNKEYMQRYPKFETNTRVVNDGDAVTVRVPGLHHVGRKVHHNKKSVLRKVKNAALNKGLIVGVVKDAVKSHTSYRETEAAAEAAETSE